ncbi:MAG: cytochrome P450 [Myxococcota bacterium]
MSSSLPPGPRHLLPTLLHWAHDPFGFLRLTAQRYGASFTLPRMAGMRWVVFSRPEHLREILTAPDDVLCAAAAAESGRWLFGNGSLFMLSGAAYLAEYRRVQGCMRGAVTGQINDVIQRVVDEESATWQRGVPMALLPTLQRMTTRVVVHALLGRCPDDVAARLVPAIIDFANSLGVTMFVPALQRGVLVDPVLRRRARVHELLRRELRRRGDAVDPADILDDLRGGDEQALLENVTSLLVAGQETLGKALAWAMYLVLAHPHVHLRLKEELRDAATPGDVVDLPYLAQVCQEALRRASVVPFVPRRALRPFRVGDYEIPVGDTVVGCLYLTHHLPDVFRDPDGFHPERFGDRTFGPFEFLPFGGGVRRCVGWHLALHEMKVLLASLLRAADYRLVERATPRARLGGVTVAPSTGTRVEITAIHPRRRPAIRHCPHHHGGHHAA